MSIWAKSQLRGVPDDAKGLLSPPDALLWECCRPGSLGPHRVQIWVSATVGTETNADMQKPNSTPTCRAQRQLQLRHIRTALATASTPTHRPLNPPKRLLQQLQIEYLENPTPSQ
jgi:hypothetical protein